MTRRLCTLFQRIDTNDDGIVEWDEFTSHILGSLAGIKFIDISLI